MKILIEGININYRESGLDCDEYVILLHGWGANINTMIPISNILDDCYKTICIDMPGFGKSSDPSDVYNSFDYARVIKKFMDKKNIKKAHFIGHSFGGKVSSIIAAEEPNRVNKLVLIDSAGLKPNRGMDYYLKVYSFKIMRWIHNNLPLPNKEKRLENFRQKYGSDDYNDASGIMRKIMVTVVNEDIRSILKDIKSETLLIWGEDDEATPVWMGEVFEKEIQNSGLVVIEGAGHYAYLDDYVTFSKVINIFL